MNDIVTLQRDAARFLAEGSVTEAIERFEVARRIEPLDPTLLFNLGAVRHNAGDRERADDLFRRAVVSEPTFARAYAHVIAGNAGASGPANALAHTRKLACLLPMSGQTHALATQYLFELGRHDFVGPAGRRSLVLEPRTAGINRLMGLSASRLQRIEEATKALVRACVLQPAWADARLALAGARLAQHDFGRALAEASTAVALDGNSVEGAFWQARASLAMNRVDDADRYFARAVAVEPERQVPASIARLTLNQSDFQIFHDQWSRDAG